MLNSITVRQVAFGILLVLTLLVGIAWAGAASAVPITTVLPAASPGAAGDYVVLAWNDLGMHCYNGDFQDLAVLPPYNSLWAQVVRVGNPPQVITTGISVTYVFTDNTYSVGKSNFWDYAQQLFGVALLPDVGLAGKGLAGSMDLHGDHFVAEGIPLTEYMDSAPQTPYPYQLATVIVRDVGTQVELARAVVVAPVSTEMHCEYCHVDHGVGNPDIATGSVTRNILTLHDGENDTQLMNNRPVLCANCHSSNALGTPGVPGLPSLSRAIHSKHKEKVHPGLTGCYSCHPGPRTQCLRDVMASQYGMDCISCHGTMEIVASNPNPWLNEPRCDNATCHGSGYAQDQALYHLSQGHGGLYCAACHDSPHAIAPSREPNDAIKFIAWQGHAGTLDTCTVCHAAVPTGAGPHGILAPWQRSFTLEPDRISMAEPGQQVVYTHTLHNTGNLADTYGLVWSSSQGWAAVAATIAPPIPLTPDQAATIVVTVTVPNSVVVRGMRDTTIVTVTSQISPTLVQHVTDVTWVPVSYIYLPLVMRNG
ncbi:MAG: hypothetical protein KKA73_23015 [Chloroflexi bacterium]|nr:hypothetical protein [Chloroflexota bacterium]MBU1750562.1 hypothetical protein [Chloroflexota bacterium]